MEFHCFRRSPSIIPGAHNQLQAHRQGERNAIAKFYHQRGTAL